MILWFLNLASQGVLRPPTPLWGALLDMQGQSFPTARAAPHAPLCQRQGKRTQRTSPGQGSLSPQLSFHWGLTSIITFMALSTYRSCILNPQAQIYGKAAWFKGNWTIFLWLTTKSQASVIELSACLQIVLIPHHQPAWVIAPGEVRSGSEGPHPPC